MQIEDGTLVKWLWEGLMVLIGSVTALMIFILLGYRTRLEIVEKKVPPDLVPRLKTLEEKMSHAVTLPQVEHIVERVEGHFKEEHKTIMSGQKTILDVIDNRNMEMREYIKDMFEAREGYWNGRDRRKN